MIRTPRVAVQCVAPCGDVRLLAAAAESAIVIVERTTGQRVARAGNVFIDLPPGHAAARRRLRSSRTDTTRSFANSTVMEAHVRIDAAVVPDSTGRARVPSSLVRIVAHEVTHLAVYATGAGRLPFWIREGFPQYVATRVVQRLGMGVGPADDPSTGTQVILVREDLARLNPTLFPRVWGLEPEVDDHRAYAMAALFYEWMSAEQPARLDSLWHAGLLRPPVPAGNTVVGRLVRAPPSYEAFRRYANTFNVGWNETRRHFELMPDTVQHVLRGTAIAWRWPQERGPYRLRVEAEAPFGAASIALQAPPYVFYIMLGGGVQPVITRVDMTGAERTRAIAISNARVPPSTRLSFDIEVDTGRVRAHIGGVLLEGTDPALGPSTRWGFRGLGPNVVRWSGLRVEPLR